MSLVEVAPTRSKSSMVTTCSNHAHKSRILAEPASVLTSVMEEICLLVEEVMESSEFSMSSKKSENCAKIKEKLSRRKIRIIKCERNIIF